MRICTEQGIYGERIPYAPEEKKKQIFITTNPENSAKHHQSIIERAMAIVPLKRGDIAYVDLGDDKKHCKIIGIRPGIVISTSEANIESPLIHMVPVTRTLRDLDSPYHVFVDKDDCINLKVSGTALCDQVVPVDRTQVIRKFGVVADARLMDKISRATRLRLGL
ncbi:type II toxin-antitoxin system PemK/MazF family toxin [Lachnotalea glycerini]|uniref:Type II toxin-antitoxin system PemK/MazF family toxin n=1 Tax=Lachnotalea glycerini TaxID=1763509 RepID=A0A371JBX5_9FIRM|nr:type II toxin-antitoxin system PemK/MazF family toxin [Lachnotalea glycerini]RDY30259.1 type II toxin-antitoxin system PemK/MazF family toxin [Lachnotalea glycerini]